MSKITDSVLALAQPVAASLGIEIWDIEYVKEAGTRFLRVYIDKADGVSIQDCENFSRAFDPILDDADPIPESYTFEVSSAGAERVLNRPSDFERFLGSDVCVKLYQPIDGSKQFVGVLQSYEDGNVTILQNEKPRIFEKSTVAQVRLHITF